jgi:hypothetical protein
MLYPSSSKIYGNSIVTQNLVVHLDPANLNSYPGYGTVLYDLTGRGNNANLVNGARFDSFGGGSIHCDGSNDVVSLPTSTDFDFPGNFTLEFWFYWIPFKGSTYDGGTGWPGLGLIHRRNLVSGTGANTWAIATNGENMWMMQLFPPYTAYLEAGHHPRYRWNQIVWTRNGSNVKLYQNGILIDSNTDSYDYTNSVPIQYGHWDNIAYAQMKGSILRIYQKGFSSTEVLQNYNANKARFENEVSTITSKKEIKTTHYSGTPTIQSAARYATDITEGTTRRNNPTSTVDDFNTLLTSFNNLYNQPIAIQNLTVANNKKAFVSNVNQENINNVINQLDYINKEANRLYKDILLLKANSITKDGIYPSSKYR